MLCFQNIRKEFHHSLSMYEHRHTFVRAKPSRLKHISNNKSNRLFHLLKKTESLGQDSIKTIFFVLQRENYAPDTWTRIEDQAIRFCREAEKSFCAHCVRTLHVPDEFNKSIVTQTIRGYWATYRNCCSLLHTCLQHKISSCRGVDFRRTYD